MNAPTKIDLPPVLPGWSDPRTQRAYALIAELYHTFPPNSESDAASAVFHAMEAIEAADCALDGGAQ
jgi:hypothetical protein